ncbi:hypothetical protein TUM22923_10050 [Polynucleobacter sp. TUM22923]|jgi:hypothetical protein|uniref:hypothetical protein n=1 Tax=Polynucleobacter sp. TUM22923 TaxID=3022126 RepID=UPI0025738DDA|nr:hypothetical protein [Polynucleobacter sp. TUM22923]BDX21684.1 hypothetical protein TUM22923_10050 [Polynucleobacter sp. TUM22923]
MNTKKRHSKIHHFAVLSTLTVALICTVIPISAQAAWAVAVGGSYGGGWRPAAYGPGPGYGGWGPGWRGGYYGGGYGYPYGGAFYAPQVVYAAPPVVTYTPPQQPMVLAAQPQAPVWYYCEASQQYFPYAQSCSSGWQAQAVMPPSSNSLPNQGIRN